MVPEERVSGLRKNGCQLSAVSENKMLEAAVLAKTAAAALRKLTADG
jgi:hypothetical protein